MDYTQETPYKLHIKQFPAEELVPLHYANTVEILIADDIKGAVFIDNTWYPLDNGHVYVVPPNIIHTTQVYSCAGKLYVLKADFGVLSSYINIPNIFQHDKMQIGHLPYVNQNYDQIMSIVQDLIANDGDFFRCILSFGQLFHIFCEDLRYEDGAQPISNPAGNFDLHELISWTQENMGKKITLQEVSSHFGYSKYYFCAQFKAQTGTTYFEYLTTVRLSHACKLLMDGTSVNETAYLSGFENVSYFIQLFKRFFGVTPKAYIKKMHEYIPQSLPSSER